MVFHLQDSAASGAWRECGGFVKRLLGPHMTPDTCRRGFGTAVIPHLQDSAARGAW